MKKTLIALAALAATGAFAQSSVTIDGIMDVGYQSITYKGGNTVQDIGGNGSSTSQINFRGSEDLGGGMKAEFRVETDWNPVSNQGNTGAASSYNTQAASPVGGTLATNSTAGSFGNGEIRVGLAGGFGRVDAGVVNFNSLNTFLVGQPYGTAMGGGFRGVYVTDTSATSNVRADNSIKYTSPSFAGFNVTLHYSAKNTKANTATSTTTSYTTQGWQYSTTIGAYDHVGNQEIGLNYSNGPLNVSYSQNLQDYDGVQALIKGAAGTQAFNTTVRTLGANYAITPALTVYFLTQGVSASDSSWDRNFSSLAVGYTFGNNVITALAGSGTNNLKSASSNIASLGYDYNLSKRTAVYARYERIQDDGGFIPAASTVDITGDNTRSRASLGVRHNF